MRIEKLSEDRTELQVTEWRQIYEWNDTPQGSGSGFSFRCDAQGKVETTNEAAAENYRRCVSGEAPVRDMGVERIESRVRLCSCGSGEIHHSLSDGHGIFLTFACDRCRQSKLAKFRPDILEAYDCDERIEADY